MYAYCATELVNPASMSFDWERVHVVWKLVYLCALATSRYSLWSFRDETDSFFWVFPLCWDCLFVRVENNWDESDSGVELWGRGSAVNERLTVLLLGQFEYVFLIGLSRLSLLSSAFLKSVCMMWLCWAEEPGSNGVHLKPAEHAHYLQPKARLI